MISKFAVQLFRQFIIQTLYVLINYLFYIKLKVQEFIKYNLIKLIM